MPTLIYKNFKWHSAQSYEVNQIQNQMRESKFLYLKENKTGNDTQQILIKKGKLYQVIVVEDSW